ncbi:hypothetical protein G7K_6534-t1 [Saitoella complicata NRRL Y-17804]|uniref:Uncharacterized protein n=1 Tax=Saitoella complicata (strain BCRC 22490 / CBS 7301 / JCM 7358 / NBRC 10748 / NRRL Y-17804) TaxID=698492 RepID=A0A0E9NRQ1_SAICN|nr:hypothetical protein G7K_6534-t1 [Saitoella complicata NRRL Y-17804]
MGQVTYHAYAGVNLRRPTTVRGREALMGAFLLESLDNPVNGSYRSVDDLTELVNIIALDVVLDNYGPCAIVAYLTEHFEPFATFLGLQWSCSPIVLGPLPAHDPLCTYKPQDSPVDPPHLQGFSNSSLHRLQLLHLSDPPSWTSASMSSRAPTPSPPLPHQLTSLSHRSISHSLSDIRSKKTSRHLSQIAAVEKEIATLTAKHVEVFNKLEDALERKETKSEYVTVEHPKSEAVVKAEKGLEMGNPVVGEGVKKLVETAQTQTHAQVPPRMVQANEEDEWNQYSPHTDYPKDASHSRRRSSSHAYADEDEFFDDLVEKRSQRVDSPLRLGAIMNHAPAALPTPPTATANATATAASAVHEVKPVRQPINPPTLTTFSPPAAAPPPKKKLSEVDHLRKEAASLTAALKSRREHLTHLRTRFTASTARLERLERDLTTISGRWEAEERARVQAETFKRKRSHSSSADEEDELEHLERSTKKLIVEVVKGAALFGLGVGASLGASGMIGRFT